MFKSSLFYIHLKHKFNIIGVYIFFFLVHLLTQQSKGGRGVRSRKLTRISHLSSARLRSCALHLPPVFNP